MNYKVWNKLDKINGVEANHFIENLKIQGNDGVFLILDDYGVVTNVEVDRVIKSNYNLEKTLTIEQVAEEYIKIIEKERENAAIQLATENEIHVQISALQEENQALREELSQIQTAITSLIAVTLEEK